jgi:hypothetical protein
VGGAELVNTAVLDGTAVVSTQIQATVVTEYGVVTIVNDKITCTSSNTEVIQVDGCVPQLTGVETEGAEKVWIEVTESHSGLGLTAKVAFRVHYPLSGTFKASLTETDLRGVAGLFDPDQSCKALMYQESIATATVSFSDGSHSNLATFGDYDVSALTTFAVADEAVGSVTTAAHNPSVHVVKGVGVGTTVVELWVYNKGLCGGAMCANASFTVRGSAESNKKDVAAVIGLDVAIFKSFGAVTLDNTDPLLDRGAEISYTVGAPVVVPLLFPGDTLRVIVSAVYDDFGGENSPKRMG